MNANEYFNQGQELLREKKYVLALEHFEEASKLLPNDLNLKKIVEDFRVEVQLRKKQAEILVEEAKHRVSTMSALYGVRVDEITDIDKIITEYAQNPNLDSAKDILSKAYYIRGMMFQSREEYIRAVEDYNEAIKNDPDHLLAFKKRSYANLELENYDQAIEDFEKIIKLDPNPDNQDNNIPLANAYMKRGIAYHKKGNLDLAVTDFEKVLELKPDDNNAREILSITKDQMRK